MIFSSGLLKAAPRLREYRVNCCATRHSDPNEGDVEPVSNANTTAKFLAPLIQYPFLGSFVRALSIQGTLSLVYHRGY